MYFDMSLTVNWTTFDLLWLVRGGGVNLIKRMGSVRDLETITIESIAASKHGEGRCQ